MDFEYPVIDKKKLGSTLKRYMQDRGLTARCTGISGVSLCTDSLSVDSRNQYTDGR